MLSFVADFETTTTPPARVWGWGINLIGSDNIIYGNSIESFMEFITKLSKKSIKIYFHNLKFDGEFIIHHMLSNGYEYTDDTFSKKLQFNTLITDMGQFFSLSFCKKVSGKNKIKITFLDSLKILPMSVEGISNSFGLSYKKLEIDYKQYRDVNHELTADEKDYIGNDLLIVSKGLEQMFYNGLDKMTIAGNALANFKKTLDGDFEYLFPKLSKTNDFYLRQSYKGGFTYLNPKYKNIEIFEGVVLDVNSLYPSVMYYEMLPVFEPLYYVGKYKYDKKYPLYICRISCQFELKEGMIPTIQLKGNFKYKQNEYVTSSNDEFEELTLTSVDLELFLKHYNVYNLKFLDGFKFKQSNTVFKKYIDYWSYQKNKAKDEKNLGIYTIAKLMLNSLYGKFGMNPVSRRKIPKLEDNIVRYVTTEKEERDPIYVAMASFITSYARKKTIESAQLNYDRYIYSDTDSIHLEGFDLPDNLEIDKYKLGAWDDEAYFKKGKYIRAKTYIYDDIKKGLKVTVAGMPAKVTKHVNFENFKPGVEFQINYVNDEYHFDAKEDNVYIPVEDMKLIPKHVEGGIILKEINFTLKA